MWGARRPRAARAERLVQSPGRGATPLGTWSSQRPASPQRPFRGGKPAAVRRSAISTGRSSVGTVTCTSITSLAARPGTAVEPMCSTLSASDPKTSATRAAIAAYSSAHSLRGGTIEICATTSAALAAGRVHVAEVLIGASRGWRRAGQGRIAEGVAHDPGAALERPMHRALVRDLDEPGPLRVVERPLEVDGAMEAVRRGLSGDFLVADNHPYALERPTLLLRVEARRHRRTGAEAGGEQLVGAGTRTEPADIERLVGEEPRAAHTDLDLEGARACLLDMHVAARIVGGGGRAPVDVARRPGGDHLGGVVGILMPGQQMIGGVERDEALRMPRCQEDLGRVVDADDRIQGRMHDEEGAAKVANARLQRLHPDVVEEGLRDLEGPAADIDRGAPVRLDGFHPCFAQQVSNVRWLGRRAQGDDRAHRGDIGGRREHGRAAQAVPDEEGRREPSGGHALRGGYQILDVGGEAGRAEVALALAQAREVEANDADADRGQRAADEHRGLARLVAGEAVGEERIGVRRPVRAIQAARQLQALGVLEFEGL